MEAKEFRKGNYVQDVVSGEWMIIDEIGENIGAVIINRDKYPLPEGWQMGPILLTPEILEKVGFVTNENKVEYVIGLPIGFGSDLFIENEDHESMSCGIKDYQGGFHYFKDIRYLHQL